MADSISGSFNTKRIQELPFLAKLNGKEEILIDNGDTTLKVNVDTLLGYIRDQINENSNNSISNSNEKIIHMIKDDSENIPSESRPDGHYYIRVVSTINAQTTSDIYN